MPAISGWSSGIAAPAHQRRDHRHAGEFGELLQAGGGIGVMHATAGDDQRALGGVEHFHRLLGLGAGGGGLVRRQRLVGVDVELDLGHLHVEGQVDQHRAGTARAHDVEGLLEHARHLRRLAHRHRPLGHRLGDRLDVHRLEVFLVQPGARRLAGDAQDGDRIGRGRVQAGDHVGACGARGADADADVAGVGTGVAFGHVRGAFDVAAEDVVETTVLLHCRVQRVDRGAGDAEHGTHAFLAHHRGCGIDCSHAGHFCLLWGMVDDSDGCRISILQGILNGRINRFCRYSRY